jgi:biotin-(acetyl-CoA carboxylase) ligase
MHYSQATALAIAQVLRRYAIHATIKWPNDILVDGKKICGILVESTSRGDEPWVIVGIGLNVCMEGKLLASIDQPATSMQELLGTPIALEEVQHLIIDSVLAAFLWAQTDPSQCQRQYVAHSRITGKASHPP